VLIFATSPAAAPMDVTVATQLGPVVNFGQFERGRHDVGLHLPANDPENFGAAQSAQARPAHSGRLSLNPRSAVIPFTSPRRRANTQDAEEEAGENCLHTK
jgi:hypothetical protein